MTENRYFKQTVRALATERSIPYAVARNYIKERIAWSTILPLKDLGHIGTLLQKNPSMSGLILVSGTAYSAKSTVADSIGKALASETNLVHHLHPSPDYEGFQNQSTNNKYFYAPNHESLELLIKKSLTQNPSTIIVDEIRQQLPENFFDMLKDGKLVIVTIHSASTEEAIRRFQILCPVIDDSFMIEYFRGGIHTYREMDGSRKIVSQ